MNLDNLHDKFTELEIVGGLLFNHDSYVNLHDILRPDHFYWPEHESIYRAFVDTYNINEPVDLMTLANKAGVNVQILVETMSDVFLGAQRGAAKRIIELAQKRAIARKLAEIGGLLPDLPVEELGGLLTQIAVGITLDGGQKKVLSADNLVKRVDEIQSERQKEPGVIRGIHTGLSALDKTLRGLRPKRLTLLVAATGFGKSSLAVNIFSNTVQSGCRSLLLSNENDIDDNLDRLAALTTGLNLMEIESGYKAAQVSETFSRRFTGKACFISDNSPRNIHEVVGTISRYVLQHQVELVFVDYVGEIALDGVKNETEEARLTRYSQALVEAARTLNCHIVCLAQLNRQGNGKGRPGKTELQGCFKMAQKAHSLLIFWQTDDGQDVISIDKNRQGPKADIAVEFNRSNQRITEQGFYLEKEKRIIPLENHNPQHFIDLD